MCSVLSHVLFSQCDSSISAHVHALFYRIILQGSVRSSRQVARHASAYLGNILDCTCVLMWPKGLRWTDTALPFQSNTTKKKTMDRGSCRMSVTCNGKLLSIFWKVIVTFKDKNKIPWKMLLLRQSTSSSTVCVYDLPSAVNGSWFLFF